MSRTSLNQKIYGPSGEVTSINELDKKGLIEYIKDEYISIDWYENKRIEKTLYRAEIKNSSDKIGWDIGKLAYLSKTNKDKIKEEFR